MEEHAIQQCAGSQKMASYALFRREENIWHPSKKSYSRPMLPYRHIGSILLLGAKYPCKGHAADD
ncbi:hypothetical protein ACJMK2_013200, partial [Sinanodonta woodiana]